MDRLKYRYYNKTLGTAANLLAILVTLATLLLYSAPNFAQQTSDQRVSITQHQAFKHLLASLKSFIQNTESQKTRHHFFIAKYPPTRNYTYIFWLEGRGVWNVNVTGETLEHWQSSIEAPSGGAYVDLDTDVVDDIGTSTYLVSKSWARQVIYDAVLNGDLVIIDKDSTHTGE
jgi:hypothetical protein